MLWGFSLQFWQTVVFWLWATAAITGGVAVAASFGSSVLSYYISDETQRKADAETARANVTAETARADAARANERAGLANEAAARATERASEADLARVKLEARMAPRNLTDVQKQALQQALRSHPGYDQIDVISEGSSEATYFATQFVSFFKSIGLKSSLRIETYASGPMPPGPFVIRSDPHSVLREALSSAGFAIDGTGGRADEQPSFIIPPRVIKE